MLARDTPYASADELRDRHRRHYGRRLWRLKLAGFACVALARFFCPRFHFAFWSTAPRLASEQGFERFKFDTLEKRKNLWWTCALTGVFPFLEGRGRTAGAALADMLRQYEKMTAPPAQTENAPARAVTSARGR